MEQLRILLLEDEPHDAELIQHTIAQSGVSAAVVRVQSELTYRSALEQQDFDVILADYALPRYDAISAVQLAARLQPQTPVIVVTGAIEEDLAIQMLNVGASDYVLKTRLDRLVAVVRRAARDSERLRRVCAAVRSAAATMRQDIGDLRARALDADAVTHVDRLGTELDTLERLVTEHACRPARQQPQS